METAADILRERYGLKGRLQRLPGEHDANFHVWSDQGAEFLFKVHAAHWSLDQVECQAAVLEHLAAKDAGLAVPRLVRDRAGRALSPVETEGSARWCRLTTWLDGALWAEANNPGSQARESLGAFLGRLDRALASFSHPGANREYGWDLALADRHLDHIAAITDLDRRAAAGAILQRFAGHVKAKLADCPVQVIHNDANDRNVLLDANGQVCGLLDFGDMVRSHRVAEIAVAAAYATIGHTDPIISASEIVAGYTAELAVQPGEADLILDLVETRYAVSMAMAARQIRDQPDNAYLLISQDAVWPEMKRLRAARNRFAELRLREAAGLPPAPNSMRVVNWLEREAAIGAVLSLPMSLDAFSLMEFDQAAMRRVVGTSADRDRAHALWTKDEILRHPDKTFVAPYGEDRSLDRGSRARDLHLGIDIFAPVGTEVAAPLEGVVERLGRDRSAFGWGGAMLLRHQLDDGTPFWTFYGHLDPNALNSWRSGENVAAGQIIGRLGDEAVNGGWASHLHFQLWTELLHDELAQMPGLVAREDWEIWQSICPDPNVILQLPVCASKVASRDERWLRSQRKRHIGRVFSLSYSAPLKIVAGKGCHLFDEEGNAYLDLVNNVCHVGHCHPRVVAAGARQMGLLNTNTRYLHDNVVEYARRLTATLPSELSVCFFVNSGSEANDLALRMAQAHTKKRDVIVLDHAYHGHLTSLIDISPYKFAGRGGEGRAEHVHVAEMPDLYRGRFGYADALAGSRYAESVAEIVAMLCKAGLAPAAFFCESILGCGGQLVLPEGYLRAAYEHVRAAGGVVIADEVQVGFGRAGSHMWAFETQGVVPDIVTMGKPIGNGHPMAAVVARPEIAASFETGMEYFNTFGGNPVSAAIGLEVLNVIRDEHLMRNALTLGQSLRQGFQDLAARFEIIGDVRNLGLFLGVEFVEDRQTRKPAAKRLGMAIEMLKQRRILTSAEGPYHNVLKIKPPLVINEAECNLFLSGMEECLKEI